MNILFMGTPDFAVPSLEGLLSAGHRVLGVFTQPDKPKNRGMKLLPSPVKACALSHDIPVYQPLKMRDGEAMGIIRTLNPQLIVVAAYGRILPDEILEYPILGCINVHSSLLPKYRGAAPINWAILNGEKETGVTIMHMASQLDAGDVISQAATPIAPDETAPELFTRLAELGADLLVKTVAEIESGTARRIPQDESQATYAPMLSRELSHMDWTRGAHELHNQVRGLLAWPAASTDVISGQSMKILAVEETGRAVSASPGTIVSAGREGIEIACGDGTTLRVLELQPNGGKRMRAADYLRGHPLE